jgi:hypothetical protein
MKRVLFESDQLLMKRRLLLLPALCLTFAVGSIAADSKAPNDFSSFRNADDLWSQVEKAQQMPMERPASREEFMKLMGVWLGTQRAGAEAFLKAFPTDHRRWQARLLVVRAEMQLDQVTKAPNRGPEIRSKLEEIINAADAPQSIKGDAAFQIVLTRAIDASKQDPETFPPFYKAAAEFEVKYPEHPLTEKLRLLELDVVGLDPSKQGEALLAKLADDPDPAVAKRAQAIKARRQKRAEGTSPSAEPK